MAATKLDPDDMDLLRGVILKQRPEWLPLLEFVGTSSLMDDERESLRQAVADELVETGLREDDEPNPRGLLLEALIDKLGRR